MSDHLSPQDVEIADNLYLADLTTIEDFEMALLTLTRDIGRIEEQLEGELATAMPDGHWVRRAQSGVRFKKALKQQITSTLALLRSKARAGYSDTRANILVSQFKADWPAQYDISSVRARESRPDLFNKQGD